MAIPEGGLQKEEVVSKVLCELCDDL